jgi:hypothetical protein
MHVRLSAGISAVPTGWISVKFDIEDSYKICRENPNLVQIGQKYLALYMNTSVNFTVAGNIKSP